MGKYEGLAGYLAIKLSILHFQLQNFETEQDFVFLEMRLIFKTVSRGGC